MQTAAAATLKERKNESRGAALGKNFSLKCRAVFVCRVTQQDIARFELLRCIQCHIVDMTLDAPKISCQICPICRAFSKPFPG